MRRNRQKEKINILGEKYKLIYKDDVGSNGAKGWADWTSKTIAVKRSEKNSTSLDDLRKYEYSTLKHELIHAFLDESGLMGESNWATNEEMVDFFANQWEKINKAIGEGKKILSGRMERLIEN